MPKVTIWIKHIWRNSLLHGYHANYMNCVSESYGKWFWHCNLCDGELGEDVRKTFNEDPEGRILFDA